MSDTRGKVDLYGANYRNFANEISAEVRRETYGEDIGQQGWISAPEQDRFASWLNLTPESHVLDVCCGAGGPTLRLARLFKCSVVGLDIEKEGIATANKMAKEQGLSSRAKFEVQDVNQPLLFKDGSFDQIMCIDAINHLADRRRVLADWSRILKPNGMILFTNSVIVTGSLSSEEIRIRSSIGFCLFFPVGEDERLLEQVGLKLLKKEDVTDRVALYAGRRRQARLARAEALTKIEGRETFEGQQESLRIAELLAKEHRLSRFVFLASKPAD